MSRRKVTFIVFVITIIVGALAFSKLTFRPQFSSFGLASESSKEEYNLLDSNFNQPSIDKIGFVVLKNENSWHTRNDFLKLKEISALLYKSPEVRSISSLPNLIVPKRHLFGYRREKLLKLGSDREFEKTAAYIAKLPQVENKFLTEDRKIAIMYLGLHSELSDSTVFKVKEILDGEAEFIPYQSSQNDKKGQDEMLNETLLIAVVSMLSVLLMFYWFTRSFRGLFLVLIVVAFNLATTFLIQYLLHIPFGMSMIAVPCLIILLSFSDLLHLFHLQTKYKISAVSDESMRCEIFKEIRLPMFLTSLSNLFGFVLFLFLSDTAELTELTIVSLLGVIVAYLSSRFMVLPVLTRKDCLIEKSSLTRIEKGLKKQISALLPKAIYLQTLLVMATLVLSFFLIKNFKVNVNPDVFISQKTESNEAREILQENFFGNNSGEILVQNTNSENRWTKTSQLKIDAVEKEIKSLFQPQYISSTNDMVKRYNWIQSFGKVKAYRIMNNSTNEKIEPFIDALGGKYLVAKTTGLSKLKFGFLSGSIESNLEKYDALERKLKQLSTDEVTFKLSGKSMLSDRAALRYSHRILAGLFIGLFLSSILVFLTKKSFKMAFGTFLVNMIPMLIALLMLLAFRIQINPQSLFLLSVLLGLCIDDSIYMMSFRKKKVSDLNLYPIVVTSAVIGVGFASLFLSSYAWLVDFALVFVVGVFVAFVLDVFVYPTFMKFTDPEE